MSSKILGPCSLLCFLLSIGLIYIIYVSIKSNNSEKTSYNEPASSLYESNSRQCNLFKQHDKIETDMEFPYFVFIRNQINSTHYRGCSGAIIDKRIVLTNAHCIHRKADVEVIVGLSSNENTFWDLITDKHQAKVHKIFVVIQNILN